MGEILFGKICLKIIRVLEAPIAFEDKIYSSFFNDLILVLSTLAYDGHIAIPTANIAELMPGPIAAFIDKARINDGNDKKTSVIHIKMSSIIPEKYPEIDPTINPKNNAIKITENAILMVVLVPSIILLKISLPAASVPK
jgi:hypothetical protein